MTNLNSIYHQNFDKLLGITNHHGKSIFLDQIIYWWQISTFDLNDNQKWFCRPLSFIAEKLKVSIRTVGRYLQDFAEKGWIEKVSKLRSKKVLYIRVTDTLLQLIGSSQLAVNQIKETPSVESKNSQKDPVLPDSVLFEKDNLSFSIYKDKDTKSIVNNNVSVQLSVDKASEKSKNSNVESLYPSYKVEELIGDIITTPEKNYIKGMLANLKKQYQLEFSSPEQLFAEIVFCIKNEVQLQGIHDFNHRVQIIAKLLRQKRWLTPKGFYNHSKFGAFFKKELFKSTKTSSEQQPSSQNNQKHELLQNIKTLKSTLNASVMTMYSEINYYKTMRLSHGKLTHIPESLTESILEKIKKIQHNHLALQDSINHLEHELETMKGVGYNMIHNNFEYFESLRETYVQLKLKTEWVQTQITQVKLNSPEETALIDIYQAEYNRLTTVLEKSDQKMSMMADKLFHERAA